MIGFPFEDSLKSCFLHPVFVDFCNQVDPKNAFSAFLSAKSAVFDDSNPLCMSSRILATKSPSLLDFTHHLA
jgi:hypothetical protein